MKKTGTADEQNTKQLNLINFNNSAEKLPRSLPYQKEIRKNNP